MPSPTACYNSLNNTQKHWYCRVQSRMTGTNKLNTCIQLTGIKKHIHNPSWWPFSTWTWVSRFILEWPWFLIICSKSKHLGINGTGSFTGRTSFLTLNQEYQSIKSEIKKSIITMKTFNPFYDRPNASNWKQCHSLNIIISLFICSRTKSWDITQDVISHHSSLISVPKLQLN